MAVFIFSYHLSKEDEIKQLGDEYAKHHEKLIHAERSSEEHRTAAQACEKIIADLRKVIVRSEIIYKHEQEQLNKSIEVAMKAREIIRRKNSDDADNPDEEQFDASEVMEEMEENPEIFSEIVEGIDEGYDVKKLKSGYNKVMDLMEEISKNEELRVGMFNIPD